MRIFIKIILTVLVSGSFYGFTAAKEFTVEEKKLIEKYNQFLDKNFEIEFIDEIMILERKPDSSFVMKIINPDKVVKTHEINYYKNPFLKHGMLLEWYDNGKIWKKGQYEYGLKQGLWKYYSRKGKPMRAGAFVNGKKEGTWIFQEKNTKEVTHYKNGKKTGFFERYDADGKLCCKELYENDSLVNTILAEKIIFPKIKGGNKKILKLVSRRITFPKSALRRNIEGKAVFIFTVEKNGEINKIIPARGVCNAIEQKVYKAIKKLPKFTPGMKNGKPIRCNFQIPVKFKKKGESRIKYWIDEE